jgi:flagellar protein FliO/FliZ
MFSAPYLLQVFGSLLLVSACLFGLVFLLKRMNHLPANERKSIRVLSSVKVGSREKIMLVEAGERQILVGVTPGSIRTLYAFGGAVGEDSAASSGNADFASMMRSNPQADGN